MQCFLWANDPRICYMRKPILAANRTDDDRPSRPDPLEDALSSAQCRRYQKTLLEDSPNDYGYSD